jgi:hypothetical protein
MSPTRQPLPPPEQPLHLSPEAQRAYDALVRPSAILPVPRYFQEHWLPLLGTSRAWLALAFRQVAFVSKAGSAEVPVKTTLRKLGMWCGLTHVRVHQVLQRPGYLTWFVRNPAGQLWQHTGARSQPRTFVVRADIPLTPEDQARLFLYLAEHRPVSDKEWLQVLENAVEARGLRLPKGVILPDKPRTVQEMVYSLRGDQTPLPPSIDEACTELHARWVQPDRATLITHYFIRRWLPELSPGLGWLIVLLRSRAYLQEGTDRGHVWIEGGWSRLAKRLGVSRKSLSRWSCSPIARLFFERSREARDPVNQHTLLLTIRLSEPIHEQDAEQYHALLQTQNLTKSPAEPAQDLTSALDGPRQSLTSSGEPSTRPSQNLTAPAQDLTCLSQDLPSGGTLLNKSGTELNALKPLKETPSQISPQLRTTSAQDDRTPARSGVVAEAQWPIERILQQAGVASHIRETLLHERPQNQQRYLGWFLFALGVSRIRYPALFAYKRYREGPPPAPYEQIVGVGLGQLMDWLAGRSRDVPQSFEQAIQDMRNAGAYAQLEKLWDEEQGSGGANGKPGATHPQGEGREMDPERQRVGAGGLTVSKAWKVVRGELNAHLGRADFDTWVRDVSILGYRDGVFLLGAANDFAREWLEQHIKGLAEDALSKVVGEPARVEFLLMDEVGTG